MALLFIDGFDHYATADILKKYTASNSTPSINLTAGRRSGGCLQIGSATTSLTKSITSSTQIIVGAAINRTTDSSASGITVISLLNGSTAVATLQYVSGTFRIINSGATLGTSSVVNSTGVGNWNYVEWKMQIADSIPENSCIVKVNGIEVLNLPTATDTRYLTNPTTIDGIRFGSASTSMYMYIDDFYICNTATAVMSDFLGDVRIDTLFPNVDGTYNDGVPSTGTDSWSILDNVPASTSSYVSLTNTDEKETVQFTNLQALSTQTIYGVQLNVNAVKSDAGAKIIAPVALSNATLQEATSSSLATSYSYSSGTFLNDPNTGAAWTESAINSAEFGIIVK
jgi:hypothetical protein